MSILETTTDLVDLFTHAHWYGGEQYQGVPKEFAIWSALSMIAGAVGDRVWLEAADGTRTYPNLYVVLVAPSGAGKGVTVDPIIRYLYPVRDAIRLAPSKMTSASCMDFLSKPKKRAKVGNENGGEPEQCDPRIYMVHEELIHSVGEGAIAKAWMTFVTAHFKSPMFFMESTRTSGEHKLDSPAVINWLGCTTPQWLRGIMTHQDILAGFAPRIVWVTQPTYNDAVYGLVKHRPSDFAEVDAFISACTASLALMPPGPLRIDRNAFVQLDEWLRKRERPAEHDRRAFFQREGDLAIKVAMLHCLNRFKGRIINLDDVLFAEALIERWRTKDVLEINGLALMDRTENEVDKVAQMIKQAGRKGLSERAVSKACKLPQWKLKLITKELMQRATITVADPTYKAREGITMSGTIYVWVPGNFA